MVGGIYAGIFPPTVGGAIGAAGVFIYALARRIGRRKILNSFWETALTNVQLFPLIIDGFMFGRFIALSGLTDAFGELITSAGLPPLGVMAIVVVIYLFLGCVMELFSMLIITIPIVFPVLTGLGYDPIVLCIILVFLADLAALTPPIGLVCFLVAGIARVNPSEVFRGILPFFLVQLVVLWIVILFPAVVTWLPSLFF